MWWRKNSAGAATEIPGSPRFAPGNPVEEAYESDEVTGVAEAGTA
jgi:hypothetical protein